jgi:3-oxoacyl-[acyl-carrier protein] reductase
LARKTERQGVAVVAGAEGALGAAAAAAVLSAADLAVTLFANNAEVERPGITVRAPIGAADEIEAALDELVMAYGPLRVLVNCPPPAPSSMPTADFGVDDFRGALSAGLETPFIWARTAGGRMLADGGGTIVNIVRLSGLGGWPGYAADGAAMAGLINLTHTMATEWAERGVRVNAIAMGVTADQAKSIAVGIRASEGTVVGRVPAGRLADVSDIGNAIAYLVDPQSSFVNGEVLRVDGGWDVWGRLHPTGKAK